MKGSCTLVASALAASTVALSSASSEPDFNASNPCLYQKNRVCSSSTTSEKEKFAPRFDGLRFIETLVTAHR